jgi:hypothetical protein
MMTHEQSSDLDILEKGADEIWAGDFLDLPPMTAWTLMLQILAYLKWKRGLDPSLTRDMIAQVEWQLQRSGISIYSIQTNCRVDSPYEIYLQVNCPLRAALPLCASQGLKGIT